MSNFEKQIKQQGGAFSIEPREQVWHRVEAELDKKKDRRIAAWWWMTPFALLLTGGIFYYTAIHKENKQKTVVSNSPQKTNKVLTPTEETNNTTKEKQETTVTKTDNTTHTATIENHIKIKNANHSGSNALSKTSWPGLTNKNKNTPESTHTNKTIHTTSVAASIAVTGAVEKMELKKGEHEQEVNKSSLTKDDNAIIQSGLSLNNTPANNENNTGNKELTEVKKTTAPVAITTDTATNATLIPDITFRTPDSLTAFSKDVAVNKPSSKKITWRLQLAGGITNNTKNDFPFTNGHEKLYTADPQNNTGGGSSVSVRLPAEPNKTGVSLSISLQRLQWLNKRWQWQADVGAQYHQIQQTTGTRKDSVITPSTLNDFSYRANYFYSGGSNVSHTGRNYRIFLSNDFAFALLKHKRSLLLSAGIYTGYNVYNNYLIADYTSYRYVKSGNLYKKWFAGMNLGLEYNFKKGFTVGVTVRRDLTKSYTPVGGDKQYWQSFLLDIGIPLNRK